MADFKFKVAYTTDPNKIQPAIDAGLINEGDLIIINDKGKGSMKFITDKKELIGMDAEVSEQEKESIIAEVLVETDERYASLSEITVLDGNSGLIDENAVTVDSASALANALADETVTSIALTADLTVNESLEIANRTLTLDLAGHTLKNDQSIWDDNAKNWSNIRVSNATLTLVGDGTIQALENDCYAIDLQDNATLYIKNGTYIGNISSVYLYGENSKCYIEGGKFEIQQLNNNGVEGPYGQMINIYNPMRNSAECVITGGVFVGYNPAEPEEGDVQYLPAGYTTQYNAGDNTYTVAKEG